MGIYDEASIKLNDEQLSFTEMIRLLRSLWVLDMGSILEEVFEDGGMVPVQLYLNTGLWKENKKVLEDMKKNKTWWNTYYSYTTCDNTYIFIGESFGD